MAITSSSAPAISPHNATSIIFTRMNTNFVITADAVIDIENVSDFDIDIEIDMNININIDINIDIDIDSDKNTCISH